MQIKYLDLFLNIMLAIHALNYFEYFCVLLASWIR